jgi:hypothetical protein
MTDLKIDTIYTPEQLNRFMVERGLSLRRFCREAGVAPSVFRRWHAGTSITLTTYAKFMKVLASYPVINLVWNDGTVVPYEEMSS